MNLRDILTASLLLFSLAVSAYSPAGDRLTTPWTDLVTPDDVWNEYPRPLLQRSAWMNLNGLWDYAIVGRNDRRPDRWDGEILVPFAVESSLSGVARTLSPDSALWYRRTFTIPSSWRGQDVMLNFGAVDWQCDVWVNGVKVGAHSGGYAPFSFNITQTLDPRSANTVLVRVLDPTDAGRQPVGKQSNRPHGIWYTAVSGIWQTVWLEPVPAVHIASLRTVPDVDRRSLSVAVTPSDHVHGLMTEVMVLDSGRVVASGKSVNGQPVDIDMPSGLRLWSPDDPHLYDLDVRLYSGGRLIDRAASYAAMRKIAAVRSGDGHVRMQLNGRDIFQYGPLDQGWWPDGLYTAPTPDAMRFDIDRTKELGFNMIRKHVKVEPALWYTCCDRAGILVWQDMPNVDRNPGYVWNYTSYFDAPERKLSAEDEDCFRREWAEIVEALHNHPSIVVWVPFNEGWGQFDTPQIAGWTRSLDPSRLVNPASGGNFFPCGDILDIHHYPGPAMTLYDGNRVNVLGEFGGIGLAKEGHLWTPDRNWGYVKFKTEDEVTDRYVQYVTELIDFVPKGFSAAVYTQTTDVEIEVNGLMTYDRRVLKVDPVRVADINRRLVRSLGR